MTFLRILCLTLALFSSAQAQSPVLPGPGLPVAAGGYVGPGNVKAFTEWGSCSRAYNTAKATTATSLCDLVQGPLGASPGTAVCTLRATSSGFVDLTAYCPGSVTPSAACAAVTGGKCNVAKVYGQVAGNDWTQGTVATQPPIQFSAQNGLPGISFDSSVWFLGTSGITQAQPFTLYAVYNRTDLSGAQGGVVGSDAGTTVCVGGLSNNQGYITAGTNQTYTAADAAPHVVSGLFNGASSATNVDGTDAATAGSVGTNSFSSNALRIGRCDGASFAGGFIFEVGYLGTSNSTERGNLSTNARSSANGYNF